MATKTKPKSKNTKRSTPNSKLNWRAKYGRKLIIIGAVVLFAGIGTYFILSSKASPIARAKLIKTGFDIPSPAQVAANKAWIDSLPFDGIDVTLPGLDGGTFSTQAHSLSEYQNAIATMPQMSKVTHNFLRLTFTQPSYDWYNDADWTTTANNIANLSQAASASGKFDGIMIDPEYYGTGSDPWNFGSSTSPWTYSATAGATPGHTAADATAQTQMRGRQIMDAVKSHWGNAQVIIFHGPYVSEQKSGAALSPFYNDVAWANELIGTFSVGMVQSAAGSNARVHDGGEIYNARTTSDFQKVYDWQKTGLANSGTAIMPASFASTYKDTIRASIGVYDKDSTQSTYPTLSAATWQTLLTNAMQREDDYVWAYTESYDWLRSGWPTTPVPQAYIDATRAAIAAAEPTNTDTVPPVSSLTAPTSGATVSGTITLSATATDNVSVLKNEFYVNGSLVATSTVPPYSFALDTTKYANGAAQVQAKAYDSAGNVGSSVSTPITISNAVAPPPTSDTIPPTVTITQPTADKTVGNKSTIVTASATDNVAVIRTELYIDGSATPAATVQSGQLKYTWNTRRISRGAHTLTVKSYDSSQNTGLASVVVYK